MFTKAKRKLLAESLTKAAEYVLALIILGQFVMKGNINILGFVIAAAAYILLIFIAMLVVPEEGE